MSKQFGDLITGEKFFLGRLVEEGHMHRFIKLPSETKYANDNDRLYNSVRLLDGSLVFIGECELVYQESA